MAKAFDGIAVIKDSTTLARSLRAVSALRLVLGLTALLGAIIFLEGTSWDIQWHSYIRRSNAHPTAYHDVERSCTEWHLWHARSTHRELVGTAQ